jgi:hypothetical protein
VLVDPPVPCPPAGAEESGVPTDPPEASWPFSVFAPSSDELLHAARPTRHIAPIAKPTSTRAVLTIVAPFERHWAGRSGAAHRIAWKADASSGERPLAHDSRRNRYAVKILRAGAKRGSNVRCEGTYARLRQAFRGSRGVVHARDIRSGHAGRASSERTVPFSGVVPVFRSEV